MEIYSNYKLVISINTDFTYQMINLPIDLIKQHRECVISCGAVLLFCCTQRLI